MCDSSVFLIIATALEKGLIMITTQITCCKTGVCLLLAGLRAEIANIKICFFETEFDFRNKALKAENQ